MAEDNPASEVATKSYFFVSYSHYDRDRVVAEIQRLEASGIPAWYDRTIRRGSTWSQELAETLSGAQALVFFATRHSIDSETCADEIVYALDEKLPVITIYLDDVQLPKALRLRLASRQAIHQFRLPVAWDRSARSALEPAVASVAVLPFLTIDTQGLGERLAVTTIGQLSSRKIGSSSWLPLPPAAAALVNDSDLCLELRRF